MTSFIKRATLAAAIAAGTAHMASAQAVTLRISHYLPPTMGLVTQVIEPWAEDLRSCANGQVEFEISGGGSALGGVARQYDQVRAGIVDVAFGLQGIPRGRFPATSLLEVPFIADSARAASLGLWDIFPDYLAGEYEGVHVLALTAPNPAMLNTRAPVRTPDDLAGMRIRTPSPGVSAMLTSLGATPVGLPPSEMYENLQRGTLDGAAIGWNAVASFRLYEVTEYHTIGSFYVVPFFFAMNQNTYDTLPETVRSCVDQISGDGLVAKIADLWDEWDAASRARIEAESDNTFIVLTEEETQVWHDRLAPISDELIASAEDQGVANAREIYEALVAAIQSHE
jgi:TRAP-type C4-dicarboxylate transport system substrate-binding protein